MVHHALSICMSTMMMMMMHIACMGFSTLLFLLVSSAKLLLRIHCIFKTYLCVPLSFNCARETLMYAGLHHKDEIHGRSENP